MLEVPEKEPQRRYQSARDVADELQRFLNGETIVARPVGQVERLWRWCKRKPVVAEFSATVIVTLVTGVVVSTYFAFEANRKAAVAKALADDNIALAENEAAAREDAERQLLQLQSLRYASQIASAQQGWETNELVGAWEHLDVCQWNLRGWEHDYLYTLFNKNQQTIGGHSDVVECVAVSPDGRRIVSRSSSPS